MISKLEILDELKKEGLFLSEGYFNPSFTKKFNRTITEERKEWYESCIGEGLSEKVFCIMNNIEKIPTCLLCGYKVKFISFREGYRSYCGTSCRAKGEQSNAEQTNLKKYGVKHPAQNKEVLQKMKNTTKERYGVENIFEDSKRIKQAVFNKYGVTNVMGLEKTKLTLIDSNLKKYGVPYALQHKDIIAKRAETNLLKYGNTCSLHDGGEIAKTVSKFKKEKYWEQLLVDSRFEKVNFNFTIDDYHGTLDITTPIRYHFECKECHTEFKDYIAWNRDIKCPKCNPVQSQGVIEKELCDWISLIIPNVIRNTRRLIPPLEIDIYLPDNKLAIEFDEVYWHSENSSGRGNKYHINKTIECSKLGISLIHVYDSEWIEKKEIVKSIILSKLGIYKEKIGARKCEIKDVTSQDSSVFLTSNHIQGFAPASIRKGLYYNNILVALLLVSPNRFKKGTYEIVRFAIEKDISVQGALSKLWKYVKMELPENYIIISYADKRFFSGNSNEVIGLKHRYDNKPQYYYTKDYYFLHNRMGFQKKHLGSKLIEYNPELTEWQNMQMNGYDRIWDCGTAVFSNADISC